MDLTQIRVAQKLVAPSILLYNIY